MQLATINNGFEVKRVTTEKRGSWKWQNAFRTSTYTPRLNKRGDWIWVSTYRGGKFAYIKATAYKWKEFGAGSLHQKPASHCTDNFGNLVFMA